MIITKSIEMDVQPHTYWLVQLQKTEYDSPRNDIIYIQRIGYEQRDLDFIVVSDEDAPLYCWDLVYKMRFIDKINVTP